MRPRDDLAVIRFDAKRQGRLACDAAKPCPALYQELVGRHERVLGTEPVSHDPHGLYRVGLTPAAGMPTDPPTREAADRIGGLLWPEED